jgi:Ca2+-binding EF-hand superfamily protein
MNKYRYTALILGSSLAVAGSAFAGVAFAGGGDCDKAGGHAGRGAARFEQIDSDKDGKISLAELTTSRESWLTQVDTNKDGVATQAEIDASMASKRKEHQQKMFERDDANKDGRLTREETRLPSAWFEKADANKDGALTLAELGNAHNHAGAKQGHGAGKASRFDENGDGKVERQELRTAAANQFAQLDKNKDGSLTSDEFRAQRHGRHRRGPGNGADAPAGSPAPVRS